MSSLNINDFLTDTDEVEKPIIETPQPSQSLPNIINGRYKIKRVVGVGGMGVVYEVSDLLLSSLQISNNTLAIKILNGEANQYNDAQYILVNEYLQAKKLHHPNIVPILQMDLCNKTNKAFLLMPMIHGELLSILLDSPVTDLSKLERITYATQLVNTISHCHDRSVIHGDIKPGNVLISKSGEFFLFDFSISRSLDDKDNQYAIDYNKVHAWSGHYVAPEVLHGQAPTIKSDLFSLSVLIYKLLFNVHPYQQEELVQKHSKKSLANIQSLLLQGMTPLEKHRKLNFHQLNAELNKLVNST
ncbi:MAG: protein kinase [Aliivibrio sp.]|uniref:protein kinase domain-containing protein n=1 Tax=Aliivibrio sp. TaxID=1872443 RepID=UPI001A4348A3|nr:protein kinase [Aliivibrio sp.]